VLKVLVEGGAQTNIKVNFNPHSIGAVPTSPDRDETGMPNERMDHMPLVALAACWSDIGTVNYLLEQGQDLKAQDRKGRNCLHGFLDHYQRNTSHHDEALVILDSLIAHGADPNQGDENGNTPMHFMFKHNLAGLRPGQTTYANTVKLAERMISHGGDPLQKNHDGKDCLDLAGEHTALAGLLLAMSQQQTLQESTPASESRPRHRF
jgi:ankyrin repeat protein